MSKTLPSVAPTLEDRDVWWWHVERRGREFSATKAIFCVYAAADRRDAEVMLFQMKLRDEFKPQGNYIRWMDLHPGADWRAECL